MAAQFLFLLIYVAVIQLECFYIFIHQVIFINLLITCVI